MEVACYARVSTSQQQHEGTIESQRRSLKQHIQHQGWSLLPEHEYIDDGISGARLDRPALDRLRDAARRVRCRGHLVAGSAGPELCASMAPDRGVREPEHLPDVALTVAIYRELKIVFLDLRILLKTLVSCGMKVLKHAVVLLLASR